MKKRNYLYLMTIMICLFITGASLNTLAAQEGTPVITQDVSNTAGFAAARTAQIAQQVTTRPTQDVSNTAGFAAARTAQIAQQVKTRPMQDVSNTAGFAAAAAKPESKTQASQDESETQTASDPKEVVLKGLNKKFSKAVSSSAVIKDTIRVSPAHACKVKLQSYQSSEKKWVTRKTYTLKKSGAGKVTLTYPSGWKAKKKTSWRVYIPAAEGYRKYISPTITITSTRPKNPGLRLRSKSAVILRASDGYVIYGKKKDKKLPNASTTKMLTALLTIEKGNLGAVTRISSHAASTGYGCLWASAGMRYRVRDLLNVMLVHSSNDAAAALAEYNAGSIKKFATKMNRRAKELGCKNTHFANPHGLPDSRHYSTAYDLAMIQRQCIKHATYRKIIRKKRYSFSTVSKPKRHYSFGTTDALLGSRSGFLGGKTGYTRAAGSCFCGVYKYNGVTYIYTVLGSSTSAGRWGDCRKLMDFIKKNYK